MRALGDRDLLVRLREGRHAPCRRAAAADQAAARSCGLGCGENFVNLVGHSAGNDYAARPPCATPAAAARSGRARAARPIGPRGAPRPRVALPSGAVAAAAAAMDAKTSLLGHGAHAS